MARLPWEYRQLGLFQFASVMQIVYQSKLKDDPYADWHIAKIEADLLKVSKAIQTTTADYDQKIQHWRGLEIKVFGNQKPMKCILHFSSPLAYLAASVMGELDYLLRQAYTFRKLGILPESHDLTNQIFWAFKATLNKSRQWQHTGVTRQDILERNQKAVRAKSILGKVPPHILSNNPKQKK